MKQPQPQKKSFPFSEVISALLDTGKAFSPRYLHSFSDLNPKDLEDLKKAWPRVPADRRVNLVEDLENVMDSDTLVNFDNVARFALDDEDARVRAVAMRLLWETDDTRLVPIFTRMMQKDPDPVVRASAATALGMFVYLGELEEIRRDIHDLVVSDLLDEYEAGTDALVRRRVLESLGFSSNERIPALIQAAFDSNSSDWMASALFAMGRSADNRWEPAVLSSLDHPTPDVQLEAVRAAGLLELGTARQHLIDLLTREEEVEVDEDVVDAAIWALSQIGGEGVRETLEELLEKTEDEEQASYIEDALDNLLMTENINDGLGMFEFDLEKGEGLDFDLDEETDDDEDKKKPAKKSGK